MKKTLSPEQAAARDARRAKFRALARAVSKMTPEQREALAARLPGIATIEGRALSCYNACMVCMQMPSATLVGGFRQWIKHGRCVMKGQHGIGIWVPTGARGESAEPTNGEASEGESVRFIFGTVFDVSQTQEIAAGEPGEAIDLPADALKLETAEVAA